MKTDQLLFLILILFYFLMLIIFVILAIIFHIKKSYFFKFNKKLYFEWKEYKIKKDNILEIINKENLNTNKPIYKKNIYLFIKKIKKNKKNNNYNSNDFGLIKENIKLKKTKNKYELYNFYMTDKYIVFKNDTSKYQFKINDIKDSFICTEITTQYCKCVYLEINNLIIKIISNDAFEILFLLKHFINNGEKND